MVIVTGSGCLVLMVQGASYTQAFAERLFSPGEFQLLPPSAVVCTLANFRKKVNKKVKKSSPVDMCKTLWIRSAFCVGV